MYISWRRQKLPHIKVLRQLHKRIRRVVRDLRQRIVMPTCPTFLTTLAFLSYKLLIYSERDLNFISLLFCIACAWCIGQLVNDAMGGQDNETQLIYSSIRRVISHLRLVLGDALLKLCEYAAIPSWGLTVENRQQCYELASRIAS